jgi:hypothetical protein
LDTGDEEESSNILSAADPTNPRRWKTRIQWDHSFRDGTFQEEEEEEEEEEVEEKQ